MSQSKELQEQYYYNYWHKIEQATDGEPTMFIRDYLTLKNKVISNMEELYFDFKAYDEKENMPREELLADMWKYAKYYRMANKGETQNSKINRKLHYPSEMLYLATKNDMVHATANTYSSPVADNCHVWTSNDTRTKRGILLYIIKEIGISPSELELELVPLNDNTISDNVED